MQIAGRAIYRDLRGGVFYAWQNDAIEAVIFLYSESGLCVWVNGETTVSVYE